MAKPGVVSSINSAKVAAVGLETVCGTSSASPKSSSLAWACLVMKTLVGFYITVNDTFGVRGMERISQLESQRQQDFRFQIATRDKLGQRHAIQKLHNYEGLAVLLIYFMNRADVGMVEGGGGAGFAAEALECLWVLSHVLWQKFQRHEAAQLSVLCLVHHTHATTAELFNDAVV